MPESLIPPHGGYKKLKSFQIARLAYDVTVRFCDSYIEKRSGTHNQMVQAARSGTQNIAEGSMASGTSKKTELKLTNVARASLEELRLDYEDYLRQHELEIFPSDHPALVRFKERRCATPEEVWRWVRDEIALNANGQAQTTTDAHGRSGGKLIEGTLTANAALSLINLACMLLDRQLAAQARAFEIEGGFTERLYRVRSENKYNKK